MRRNLLECISLRAAGGLFVNLFAASALAATISVNTTLDAVDPGDGLCSLREAITAVNTASFPENVTGECNRGDGISDVIMLPPGLYGLSMVGPDEDNNQSGDLDIRADVTISGAGSDATYIDASGFGGDPDRVMHVPVVGLTVVIHNISLQYGHAPDGTNAQDGGGLLVANADVTLLDAVLRHNQTGIVPDNGIGRGGQPGKGGGVDIEGGSLNLVRSIVSQNQANSSGAGGGIFAVTSSVSLFRSRIEDNAAVGSGTAGGLFCGFGCGGVIEQSSITGNVANGGGGGVYLAGNTPRIINSTIAGNVAANNGAGVYVLLVGANQGNPQFDFVTIVTNQGSGIHFDNIVQGAGSVNLRNSIVAENSGTDCFLAINGNFFSQGYNFSGTGCPVDATDVDGSTVPLHLSPLTIDELGFTRAMLPRPHSPIINGALCSASGVFVDQRGHLRPAEVPNVPPLLKGCDIGAAELDDVIFWDGMDPH